MGTAIERPRPLLDICLVRSVLGGIRPFNAAHIAVIVPLQRRRVDVAKISGRAKEIL